MEPTATSVEISAIYEDEELVVINKPALIHSVFSTTNESESVAKWLCQHYAGIEYASEDPRDGGLTNRLDFETSGVLIAAKSRQCWLNVREQYRRGLVTKTYLALVRGRPTPGTVIEGYVGNRYRGSTKVTFQKNDAKRFTYTRSIIEEVSQWGVSSCYYIAKIRTNTGARHQIRAHCAEIGHPLRSDTLYGAELENSLPHFILHASTVELQAPKNNEPLQFSASTPQVLHSSARYSDPP